MTTRSETYVKMRTAHKHALSLAAALILTAGAFATQGPDVTVLKVGVSGGDNNDFPYYGQSGGIAAYSMATTSCNVGNQTLLWFSGGNQHPVIGQNMFRLKDGRFEQLGQSWLKHGFCAVNEPGCGSCQSTNCDTLGIGCADTYWGTLNDGQGGGPKSYVNPTTGVHTHPDPSPSGPTAIRGRLQVAVADIDPALNPGAEYFAESQYIAADDAQAGNGKNNASWRKLNVVSVTNILGNGPTVFQEPAIFAWRAEDPGVTIVEVTNTNEQGTGIDTTFYVAYRATDNGDGTWSYVYCVQNLNSKQSGGGFMLPLVGGADITNVYFNDVDYHSGEPYDNTDWVYSNDGANFGWRSPQTYAQNQDSNALRWGTMYTFAFDANAAPVPGTAELELFEPGNVSSLSVPVDVPGTGQPIAGTPFCFGDGTGSFCPCFNFGELGHGCENGAFIGGSRLKGFGSGSVSANDLMLEATQSVPNQPGLFYQGVNAINGGLGTAFGDGLRCAGGSVVRLQVAIADATGKAQSTVSVSGVGGVNPGDVRRYQWWYRDPSTSPCGSGFNLSNGLEVVWAP